MKQRQRLRQKWMQLMGSWPELLEHSPFWVEAARRVDQYFEQRVQLQASLGQWIDGWLLMSYGKGRLLPCWWYFTTRKLVVGSLRTSRGATLAFSWSSRGLPT